MTVVFFISGHGFGHASRQVEVINALARRLPGVRVVIRSAVSADLLRRTVVGPFDLRPGACDSGVIQSTSVSHDDEATVRAAIAFYGTFEARVTAEAHALAREGVSLIVGDIPPLAFAAAARLGVPSIAVANFTWDWIYETHPGMTDAAPWLLECLRLAYAGATLALELPFSGGFESFTRVTPLPLIARRSTRSRAATRAHFRIPADRPAVLLSFGGYGLPDLELGRVDCLADWTVVATDRIVRPASLPAGHAVFVEEAAFLATGFRYEDLVAAVDVVLTKPGYGIIAECVTTGTAMLYTSRGHFREYDRLVRDLPRFVRSRFIPQDDLFAGRWRTALEALHGQEPPPERLRSDGADIAAEVIRDVLDASR